MDLWWDRCAFRGAKYSRQLQDNGGGKGQNKERNTKGTEERLWRKSKGLPQELRQEHGGSPKDSRDLRKQGGVHNKR